MRSTRGPSGADPSRADAAARRLALLAADLGAVDPDLSLEALSSRNDYTRVVPSRRAVAPVDPEAAPVESSPAAHAPLIPQPGRHAARRRPAVPTLGLPELGAAQLAVVAVVVAVGVAVTAWWVVRDQAAPVPPDVGQQVETAEPLTTGATSATGAKVTGSTVTVDVTGKVRRPGIVVLDPGARVVDALDAAGGERKGVDLSTLNLARLLVDGEQIVVGAQQATIPAVPSGSPASGVPPTLVNLNTASQAELETLPDVGPVTALAIITWRDEHGGFTSVDELLEVDGIGETTLTNLAPYVTV